MTTSTTTTPVVTSTPDAGSPVVVATTDPVETADAAAAPPPVAATPPLDHTPVLHGAIPADASEIVTGSAATPRPATNWRLVTPEGAPVGSMYSPTESVPDQTFTLVGVDGACVTTASARGFKSMNHGTEARPAPEARSTTLLFGGKCETGFLTVALEGSFADAKMTRITEEAPPAEHLDGAAALARVRALPGAGRVTTVPTLDIYKLASANIEVWIAGPVSRVCARGDRAMSLYFVRDGRAVAVHQGHFEQLGLLEVGGRSVLQAVGFVQGKVWSFDLSGDLTHPVLTADVPIYADTAEGCGH